jgi:uncharacterized protein
MNAPRWLPLVTGPLRRPRLVLLIALVLCALSLWVTTRAHPTSSLQDMIGRNDPAARALQRVLEDFPAADELLLLVTLNRDPEAPEQAVRSLRGAAAAIDSALTQSRETAPLLRSVTYAASPQLIDFFKNEAIPNGLYYLDDAEFDALLARLTPDAMREQLRQDEAMIAAPGPAADALSRTLLKDPLRLREFLGARLNQQGFKTWNNGPDFISPDARSILIRVAGTRPPSDLAFCKEFTAKVNTEVRRALPGDFTFEASGAYAIAAASEAAIRNDLSGSVIGSLLVMQLLFLIGYRNVLAFIMAFAPIAISLCMAFGIHSLFTPALTPLTAGIGASLIACGVDYSVYFLSYYEASRGRSDVGSDIAKSLASLTVPLTAAAATSVVGFAAIAFSSVHALRDFAILGTLGLTLALGGVLWVLPAMLVVTARVPRLSAPGPRLRFGGVVRAVARTPSLWIAASLLAVVASGVAVGLRPLSFETNLNVMHPSPNAPLETERTIGAKFGSSDTLLVYIEAPTSADLAHQAHRAAQALESRRAELGISGIMGLSSVLPDPAPAQARSEAIATINPTQILADFDAAVAESSFDPAAFTQYKDFLRTLLTSQKRPTLDTLAKYPALHDMLLSQNSAHPAAMTIVTFAAPADADALPGLQDARTRDKAVTTLRAALKDIPGATITGLSVIGYDIEHAVRRDLPIVILVATLAILLLLIPSTRSFKDAVLACLPVAFGVVVLLGYMALFNEHFNLANTVSIPLLLGVGIDYGIFLVGTSRDTDDPLPRLAAGLHAIVLTGASSIIGFGSLAFTSTPAVASMGRVVTVGVAASVIGALLLLIPILSRRPSAADSARQ